MSSLIATINRDRAGVDEGNKSVCDGRTTACKWVVQTILGQPTILSRMHPAARPDMIVMPRESGGIPARRGRSALSLPHLNTAIFADDELACNVIRLT